MKILLSRGLLLAILVPLTQSFGQVGNDNPTGVSGVFNGNVTTADSYDPYTANATRSITDLVVAGSVGTYPLAFTRTMNSRGSSSSPAFGQAGSWTHSYQWNIETDTEESTTGYIYEPQYYTVDYPDGRRVWFFASSNGDPDFRGPLGVRDRMQQYDGSNCYLRLPDGGQVRFSVSRTKDFCPSSDCGTPIYYTTFTFTLTGIIDPYGQTTIIGYDANGRISTITEPAGRMLKIVYTTGPAGDTVVSQVQEWMSASQQGRTVTYNYSAYNASGTIYSALTSVSYPDGTTATYTYQNSNIAANGRPLIRTCVDPMLAGPMWKIAYTFVPNAYGVVYGELQSENYFDGTNVGAAVSTLAVTGTSTRTEARGDGPTRTFTYSGYKLTSATDFKGVTASKAYDSNGFVNSVTDRNGKTTTFTNNAWTGNVTLATYPLTASDTALGLGQATTQAVYGSSTCPDPNNRDGNNPYFVYSYTNKTMPGRRHGRGRKRGFSPTYLRDTSKRVITINYPDGGTESFTYNSFSQVATHTVKTGGQITYTHDSRGLLTQYYDSYHSSSAPNFSYAYDSLDRLQSVTDARGNTTSYTYDNRGQLLTTAAPGVAHPVANVYNTNGTLASVTNELQKQTSYTYDDYKRVTTLTLPPPAAGPSPNPTSSFYDHTGGTAADYTHTDTNPTRVILPSGKMTKTVYDNNLLKTSVTAGYNTSDAATTTFAYDGNGNLTTVTDPKGNITKNYYDQQNRLTDTDDPMVSDPTTPHKNSNGHTVSWTYDQASNQLTKLSANGQKITNTYDSMNRLTQVSAPQAPDPTAITKYTYTTAGLLQKMQDPHLVAINSNASYSYTYDLMGRKTGLSYPPDSNNATKTEAWSYDAAGNVATFTNRAGKIQTFSYDSRNRPTGFSWNDGATPSQSFAYDDASRVTQVANSNATINNTYFDNNMLKSQEEWAAAEGIHRIVNYTYDPDLDRSTIAYPGSHSLSYSYTHRDLLASIQDTTASTSPVSYVYDGDGDVTSEIENSAVTTTANFNAMNMATHLSRVLSGTTRTFDYQYDVMNNRTSIQQDGGTAKTEAYDLAEQSTTETISGTATTFDYDANGNRTGVNGTGTYGVNNLNEYTTFNGNVVGYDNNGNLTSYNGWTHTYDAQNRMISATNGSTTETFKYDGLNRQITHTLNGVTTYNVWDGWNFIEEFAPGASTPTNAYVYGARGEIVERRSSGTTILYFQDALGNTSHVSDATGHLLESYTYTRTGTPSFYNASGGPISASAYGIRHLFHGQLWTQQTGLNDYRNRMQLPSMGIFMQTDPIRFNGDPTNLYRFCGNNALTRSDPTGEIAYMSFGSQGQLTSVSIPISYSQGTGAQQAFISQAIMSYWSGNGVSVVVYQPDLSVESITNSLLIAPGNLPVDTTAGGPQNNFATIFVYEGESSDALYYDAKTAGASFMGTEILTMMNASDATGGLLHNPNFDPSAPISDGNAGPAGSVYGYDPITNQPIYNVSAAASFSGLSYGDSSFGLGLSGVDPNSTDTGAVGTTPQGGISGYSPFELMSTAGGSSAIPCGGGGTVPLKFY